MFKLVSAAAVALLLMSNTLAAHADDAVDYPERTVTIVAPFTAGGALDLIARTVAQKLQDQWDTAVIVENRDGAAGIVGTGHVAASKPDGYTLVLGATTTHGINPVLYENLRYSALDDFEPVSLVATIPHLLVVNPELKIESYEDFEKLAKERTLYFGSAGVGSPHHLGIELLKVNRGLDVEHVPYKGSGPAMLDTVTGVVDFMSIELAAASQNIKDGRLRPIAVAAKERLDTLDIPTFDEVGVADFEVTAWYALFAPKGTPQPIVEKISQAVALAMEDEELKERFSSLEVTPFGSTPEELGQYVQNQLELWGEAVKISGAKVQ